MKTCTKCGVEKPELDFYKNSSGKNGLDSACKSCADERGAIWRATHKEHLRIYQNSRRAKNPEACRLAVRTWASKNPKILAELSKKQRDSLANNYVHRTLGIPNPPPELVKMKREQLALHRATKQLQQTIKEKQDE